MKPIFYFTSILTFYLLNFSFVYSNSSDIGIQPYPIVAKLDAIIEVSQAMISSDCTVRPSVVLNGTSPGPELRFKEGSFITIRVVNQLKDLNTTIHFHGISQFGSPFSDGTPRISQFPIEPNGAFFDYSFFLEPGSAGTYLYHAHTGFEISTAYGAFIIEDVKPAPYEYDEEITMILGDYYHELDQKISDGLDAKPFKWLGEPQSLVVNGDALGTCNASKALFGCTKNCRNHVFNVKPNTVYRFRVIGITALTYLYFGIDGHSQLDIIEADGGYLKRIQTDHIRIHSGQRYSFLLKTKSVEDLKKLNFKREFLGKIESRWRPIRDKGDFILKYHLESDLHRNPYKKMLNYDSLSQNEMKSSVNLPDEPTPWLDEDFEPFDENEMAQPADKVDRRLIIQGQQLLIESDGSMQWYVNGIEYDENQPHIPYLAKAYLTEITPDYEAAKKNNGFDPKLGAFPVKLNETIELLFLNLASTIKVAEAHPWHLHGQKAFVVGQGIGPFNDTEFRNSEKKFPKRYIRRDTQVVFAGQGASYSNTTVPSGTQTGWMMMRMKAKTPGAFLLHCHTQPHAMMGMAVVLLIGVEHLPPLPENIRQNYVAHMPEYLGLSKYRNRIGNGNKHN